MTPPARLRELQVAAMLLTRLPAGRISGDAPGLGRAAWAFPLVGILIGALSWAVHALALSAGLPPAVAALLVVAAGALATGGLHHDGLADLADGLGGGRDRAHCLEIMRDSRIGSYGVLALVLALGLMAASIAAGAPGPWFLLLGAGSRLAMLAVLVTVPAAREDGLGQAARGTGAASLVPGGVAVALCAVWAGGGALLAALAMAAVTLWLVRLAVRRIGGQTGDVLGAVQMLAETAGWVVFAGLAG